MGNVEFQKNTQPRTETSELKLFDVTPIWFWYRYLEDDAVQLLKNYKLNIQFHFYTSISNFIDNLNCYAFLEGSVVFSCKIVENKYEVGQTFYNSKTGRKTIRLINCKPHSTRNKHSFFVNIISFKSFISKSCLYKQEC
ncbi:hypothetical protein C0J52_03355 [Blattella germanica]|nr:hypothetical protein C0J52_03355 [Blattella germanica]